MIGNNATTICAPMPVTKQKDIVLDPAKTSRHNLKHFVSPSSSIAMSEEDEYQMPAKAEAAARTMQSIRSFNTLMKQAESRLWKRDESRGHTIAQLEIIVKSLAPKIEREQAILDAYTKEERSCGECLFGRWAILVVYLENFSLQQIERMCM